MNALTVDMALGCSTNTVLHLPAIANEAGVPIDLNMINEISKKTPHLCSLSPGGSHHIEDLNSAGGIQAVMKELAEAGLLNQECITATGKSVGENLEKAKVLDTEVIRPYGQSLPQRRWPGCPFWKPGAQWMCGQTVCSGG